MKRTICGNLDACKFFQKKNKQESTAELFRDKYCLDITNKCARSVLINALGGNGELVPDNLYPNQHERAEAIIKAQTS